MRYGLIGIGTATDYFRVVANNGEVKIKRKLREDETRQSKYRVRVSLWFVCIMSHKTI